MELEDDREGEHQRIAQGVLVHRRKQHQQGLERLRRGDETERLHGRLGEHRVGNEGHQRTDRLRIADLSERHDRRELKPQVAPEQPAERDGRFPHPEPPRRLDRGLGDVGIRVIEQWQNGGARRGGPDAREALEREHHELGVRPVQHRDQVRDGVQPLPLQRGEARIPPNGILPIGHQLAQNRRST